MNKLPTANSDAEQQPSEFSSYSAEDFVQLNDSAKMTLEDQSRHEAVQLRAIGKNIMNEFPKHGSIVNLLSIRYHFRYRRLNMRMKLIWVIIGSIQK